MRSTSIPMGIISAGAPRITKKVPIPGTDVVLARSEWTAMQERHHQDVDSLTSDHRSRTSVGRAHPVEDFLFTYYSLRPAALRRWHPGAGIALLDAAERSDWRFHRVVEVSPGSTTAVTADADRFCAERGPSVQFIRRLLSNTSRATLQLGCFGLHEWAMVFQVDQPRHDSWPLRLGRQGTDDVVRENQIRCSHFDAFRFFTPAARPRNLLAPDLESRDRMEQPGCLHASMDLYKWAYRLLPIVSSGLLLDCFSLAKRIREVDMRASPYDLSELGYRPIPIETPSGKAEYVAAQRDFATAGQIIRARLIDELDRAFGAECD